MFNRIRKLYKTLYLTHLQKRGLILGKNFQFEKGSNIDAAFPWLIEIGDNVTFASWVYVVAHDGAAQKHGGYSKIGNIKIGNNVFIGARSIILPNVEIGDNCIIGAGSVVTHSIPENTVAVGAPANIVSSILDYEKCLSDERKNLPVYEKEYTLWGGITDEMKQKMKNEISGKGGFIV